MATKREAPRERPILFSALMVRAILDGRKTQTRRVTNPQLRADGRWPAGRDPVPDCPYGVPGDRLWVRETFRPDPFGAFYYRATGVAAGVTDHGWKPSIFMPRAASRITLEVTGVRVERLQAISEADATADGVPEEMKIKGTLNGEPMTGMIFDPRAKFMYLWNAINGKRAAWASNPWVWVVEFRRAG